MTATMPDNFWDDVTGVSPQLGQMLLITIDHYKLSQPVYIADSVVDITIGDITYLGWPCAPRLPTQGEKAQPGGVTIQNVNPIIGNTILALKAESKVRFTFKVVTRAPPHDELIDFPLLFQRNIQGDDLSITGDVVSYGADAQQFPKVMCIPSITPGLYA